MVKAEDETVRLKVALVFCCVESVACTVKVNDPAALGVPERTPPGVTVSPPGKPEPAAQVIGATPPLAVSVTGP